MAVEDVSVIVLTYPFGISKWRTRPVSGRGLPTLMSGPSHIPVERGVGDLSNPLEGVVVVMSTM